MKEQAITLKDDKLIIPNTPIIPYIEGDGIGPDIWKATQRVIEAAVEKAYDGERKIFWLEILAGEKAYENTGAWLPEETIETIKKYKVAIKGPLTTPVGEGFRSLNVTLRKVLNLYNCMRKFKWIPGVPSPVNKPEDVDVIIFRENTEDVYAGIEWESNSEEALKVIKFLNENMNCNVAGDSGIGIKPMSETASKRIIREAIQYAIDNKRKSVTMVHKGNIMKFTEGAFSKWGYEVAKQEFEDFIISEDDLYNRFDGIVPKGKIIIKDRIADNMLQQILLKSKEYDVMVMPNLNGDYFSDAIAAQIGGIGMSPGGNIGYNTAVFEATHGTAPKYKGLDKVNPSSLILSGVMMLEYMKWNKAAERIEDAVAKTIANKTVTYDLARGLSDANEIKTSEFATEIIGNM